MNDEDAYFEVWFQLQRRDHWKSLYGDEPMHEHWGEGFKGYMAKAWHARASLHVTQASDAGGQEFFRELLAALDALPNKRLIPHELVSDDGEWCALWAVNFSLSKSLGVLAVQITSGRYPSALVTLSEAAELRDWLIRILTPADGRAES